MTALAAPAAHAAPTWTEIASVPGRIYDVDAERILYRQAPGTAAILDRQTLDITQIAVPAGESVGGGFLTSHGAMITTAVSEYPYGRVREWRDGTLLLLDDLNSSLSLRVAGDYAIWADQPKVMFRDLAAGVTTELGDGGNTENDVDENGDAVWWGAGGIWRKRLGQPAELLQPTPAPGRMAAYPRTDGTTVLWREHKSTGTMEGVLRGNAPPAGGFTLSGTERADAADAGRDYDVSNGWLAFTRGSYGALSLWRRSPLGAEEQVAPTGTFAYMRALAPDGSIIYRDPRTAKDVLAVPGEEHVTVGTVPDASGRGYFDHAFTAGGTWYRVLEGSLQRLSLADAPADGSQTQIDSAPPSVAVSTTAQFTFSSTPPGAEFECRLDGGAWEDCSSPKTYTGLDEGGHSFLVRAVGAGGDVDPEPASHAWAVDVTAPTVTLTTPAAGHSTT
ncbi:MAG: hypothetical protein M3389_16115, partial [Actinomycetota bacterium]|nr:hypothetical protein [Actinomycetota bacterium]